MSQRIISMQTFFSRPFKKKIETPNRAIYDFELKADNVDIQTVSSFGEEWNAFHQFDEDEIQKLGDEYFDIVSKEMLNSSSIVLEVGCGSGRFVKYLSDKVSYIVGADPSDAIFAADALVGNKKNVCLIKASANDLPFDKQSFDFVYAIGVLHHIPDTLRAMQACVDQVKPGGYFLTYLYYNLDNRGFLFRSLFNFSNFIRTLISKLGGKPKRMICDIIAVVAYMPFVLLCRFLKLINMNEKFRSKIPLYGYENKSFYIIRNDSLDRFGTPLEQRFTKEQIQKMMESCGLTEIIFSNHIPFWHVIGKKN